MPSAGSISQSFLALSIILLSTLTTEAETNWPQWRGPLANGLSTEKGLPVQWSQRDVVWKTDLAGIGQSSPIVWQNRIYLTAASNDGTTRSVICLDRSSGKEIWRKSTPCDSPEKIHRMNSYASATCATDGKNVVAFFGRGGIHCYDTDGKKLWSRDLGPFDGPWGTGASPIIIDDLVIQNCDSDGDAFIIALNLQNGKTVWKTPRGENRGWSTPVIIDTGKRKELVVNGHTGMNAYDTQTGKQLWFVDGAGGRGTPTVVPAGDLVVAVSGRGGDMIAVRTGGSGKLNDTQHEAWRTVRRGGRDLPSPIVIGNYLFVVNLKPGIASCYDVTTGQELWKERLSGAFSSSPIAAGGLVYVPNEAGETFVIRLGKKFELVSRNTIESGEKEIFRAAITPHAGQMLIRSSHTLYCVGTKSAE